MIGRLTGAVGEKSPGFVLIDVGGVGYAVAVSLQTYYRIPDLGRKLTLHIVTHLRENALELFGFAEARERELFAILRGVSGIGPKMALAILSGMDARELEAVVGSGDVARLVSIPGVGKKTAERIVMELRDKVSVSPADVGTAAGTQAEAVSALVGLGYKPVDAARAVRGASEKADGSLEALIRTALADLS